MEENKTIVLPANDAVQNWIEHNIDKDCSASSGVYKFRLWLESLQGKQRGAVWVKVIDRLPGHKSKVKWRDGDNPSHATDGKISLFEMDKPYLDGWEWLDESGTAAAPKPYDNLYRLVFSNLAKLRARCQNNERMIDMADNIRAIIEDVTTKMLAMPQTEPVNDQWQLYQSDGKGAAAAGREEEAVEFAERLNERYVPYLKNRRILTWKAMEADGDDIGYTTAQLYELFKQEKEK